jgi:hypothetical protein
MTKTDQERIVNLSQSHREAILQLGYTASGHAFIPPDVLEELLAMQLVYWRASSVLDFTPTGERVYEELDVESGVE